MQANRMACCGLVLAGLLAMAGVATINASDPPTPAEIKMPTVADAKAKDLPGLHNVVAFHDNFWSGGVPEGEEAFATLAAMGVKTVISVDGAEPDVELAKKFGLKYIHLPIGYN